MNTWAAIDHVAVSGLGDPRQVAVVGHSCGAMMVATHLANSRVFCEGVAMSGAYNLTLTPFGFQQK